MELHIAGLNRNLQLCVRVKDNNNIRIYQTRWIKSCEVISSIAKSELWMKVWVIRFPKRLWQIGIPDNYHAIVRDAVEIKEKRMIINVVWYLVMFWIVVNYFYYTSK